ncbi:FUSC family protein [Saccharopolyspora sp. K220]|uniref:phage shock envelope stress response protein PspM n=1 Tax=Saccharopolyspora soli TaxID=2926618 RepID=UPI001F592CE2|nr:FUSC family protein [Saccharopolyspora soli]MCI2420569.1 FUSC family protein [Saccharopolyspora soli]
MKSRKQELAQLGEAALEQLRGPVFSEVRRKFASWRDPRARLIRQRKRAKRTATGSAVTAGVFGAGSAASASLPEIWSSLGDLAWLFQGTATFGLGGIAVISGVGAVGAGLKYRRLKRTPLPEPLPEPVALPPQGSAARDPMQRLRDAELSLHGALAQLTSAGAGSAAADARGTADSAAAELRRVAERLLAVEAAIRHAPAAEQSALRADVQRLRAELDEGIDGYGGLVAAAGRAVAASGAPEQKHLLQDATDRLAGLAAGLRELSGGGVPAPEQPEQQRRSDPA